MRDLGNIIKFGENIDFYRFFELEEITGRTNIGLKVFSRKVGRLQGISENNNWTEEEIHSITKLQNIASTRGLAPRVYEIVTFGNRYGQIVEYISGACGFQTKEEEKEVREKFEIFNKEFGVVREERSDNYIRGKLVDFNDYLLWNSNKYEKQVMKRLQTTQEVGHGGFQSYQTFENVPGKRDTQYRMEKFRFCDDDFKGKTVLDIGCSMGSFCHEAVKRGAKRVVGLEMPNVMEVARDFANVRGYYNIDFFSTDLSATTLDLLEEKVGLREFDIVLYLSMIRTMGIQQWVFDCCKELIYCEDHPGTKNNAPWLPTDKFKIIDLGHYDTIEGKSELEGGRKIFKGYKI